MDKTIPPYTGDHQDGAGDAQNSTSSDSDITPLNYIYVSLRGSTGGVKGTWVIDPTLEYPDEFLPPLAQGTTRKNIDLNTVGSGGLIDADIFVVPTEAPDSWTGHADERVTIKTSSCASSPTDLRIHDYAAENAVSGDKVRRPIHITCVQTQGDQTMRIHLPKTFKGPVKVLAASILYSKEAKKTFKPLTRTDAEVRGYIGQFKPSELGRSWIGDRLDIESTGPAEILFNDEIDLAVYHEQLLPHATSGNVYLGIGQITEAMKMYHGKIELKLYDHLAPKLCQNFRLLATAKKAPCYKGSKLQWIHPSHIGGGDFKGDTGGGGQSALGTLHFKPERTGLSHNKPGILSMFQHLDKQCSSVFMITTNQDLKSWDPAHIVFGEVVQGLNIVENICKSYGGLKPTAKPDLVIWSCGIVS